METSGDGRVDSLIDTGDLTQYVGIWTLKNITNNPMNNLLTGMKTIYI